MNTNFRNPIDRLLEMKIDEVITYPSADYWRVNARRTRAEKKAGGKYRLRIKGDQVFVLREK